MLEVGAVRTVCWASGRQVLPLPVYINMLSSSLMLLRVNMFAGRLEGGYAAHAAHDQEQHGSTAAAAAGRPQPIHRAIAAAAAARQPHWLPCSFAQQHATCWLGGSSSSSRRSACGWHDLELTAAPNQPRGCEPVHFRNSRCTGQPVSRQCCPSRHTCWWY
jgi:hypothetical protein